MKKRIFKKTLCVIITMLILTSSFSMTAFADTTKGTQVKGSTVYYTEDGVRTAVKTVTIDGVDYYDCSGGEPANIIEAIRLAVIRKSGENHLAADTIPELLNESLPQQAIVSAFRKYSK